MHGQTPPAVAPSWTEHYRVRAGEIDSGGALTPVALCQLLQETAGRHVVRHGLDVQSLRHQRHTWVLSRLRVEWSGSAAWLDTVAVETWASGVERLHALRDFELRGPGGAVLARAISAWLLLDLDSHRPQRPGDAIASLLADPQRRALAANLGKLAVVATDGATHALRVQRRDLDVNQHVNNVAYVGWLFDAAEALLPAQARPRALEINFLAEAFAGEQLQVHSRLDDDGRTLHQRVVRPADARELVRACTRW